MADDVNEVEEVTAICAGLNINIGTLHQHTIPAMLKAGEKANKLGHPVVFDPVGVGVSRFRIRTAHKLLENVRFAAIRGNISEIKTLAFGEGNTRGVDADIADIVTEENLLQIVNFAKGFSRKTEAVIAITGAIDIVTDGEKAYCIYNGHPMMRWVTGTGCQLSALTAAYVAATPSRPLEAVAAAVCAMGICGEKAYERLTEKDGNAAYRNYIIDAVYRLDGEELENKAKYKIF